MTDKLASDPLTMFRNMVDQWEKAVNEYGGKVAASSEFAQGMQGITAASLQMQQAVQEGMKKVLATANIPNRDEIAALGARLGAMEAQLARIESALGAKPSRTPAPKPKRTKVPPARSA